jgi:hypothetical protein
MPIIFITKKHATIIRGLLKMGFITHILHHARNKTLMETTLSITGIKAHKTATKLYYMGNYLKTSVRSF